MNRLREGTPVAFVIFSVGPVTRSTPRTVDARPLVTAASLALLLLMSACYALGYRAAQVAPAVPPLARPASRLDLNHPEARALIDRIGALSGRLTRVESEAATLARRLGVARPTDARPVAQTPHADDSLPRGGPFIPVQHDYALPGAGDHGHGDLGTGLSRLEDELARLEGAVTHLSDLTVAHDLASMAFPSRWPVRTGSTSSGFGTRRDPFTGRPARHEGLDFPAPAGTPIFASAGGRVIVAGADGAYGNAVVIDHGNGLATLYGHASRVLVHAGDLVMPRQAIAEVGSTGRSTGAHLHFEVIRRGIRVEPRDYLARADASTGRP